jgi:hypothetical protein
MTMAESGAPGTRRPANSLPAFCRTAWVSEAASELWAPRFSRIKEALEDLAAIATATAGGGTFIARPASVDRLRRLAAGLDQTVTVTEVPASDFATTYGVAGRIAVRLGPPGQPGAPPSADCVCGHPADAPGHEAASDPIWRLATRTSGAEAFDDGCGIVVDGPWSSNPLIAAIGLFPGPILPCCFACRRAEARAEALLVAAAENGRSEELDWLRNVLSWPMSWTALHGIAEIKTPVFRMVRDTGSTARTFTVHRPGTEMPEEAAKGLGFPFRNRTAGPGR